MVKSKKRKSSKTIGRRLPTYTNLKRLLTMAGLSDSDAHAVAQMFTRWLTSNGAMWTNSRWKDLRMWYETYLAGNPVIPSWFAHTKKGVPKGPLGSIFRLSVPKALLALSINTLLFDSPKHPSDSNIKKFLHGLEGNGKVFTKTDLEDLRKKYSQLQWKAENTKFDPTLSLPTVECIYAHTRTVPVGDKDTIHLDGSLETRDRAFIGSWESVPQETVEFLWSQDHLDWIPIDAIGTKWAISLDNRKSGHTVGGIGFIPEEQMKLRTVANPNRITQSTLKPLGDLWYGTLRSMNGYDPIKKRFNPLGTDCTFCQEMGSAWVQEKLSQGVELAGVDMTSATDLLQLDACLAIVNTVYYPRISLTPEYLDFQRYFIALSRGKWYAPSLDRYVSWRQGQPLGLYPSFALLGLVNNAMAMLACQEAGIPLDSFRCLGDDMIMLSEAVPYYKALVEELGGEINMTKTLTSCYVAEFGGHVMTPSYLCNKATHLAEISDDSFMAYMSLVGDRGRKFLKPRQRRVWDELKFVPGIVVPGPWSTDGYGNDLVSRYIWYLTYIKSSRLNPDQPDPKSIGESLLATQYRLGIDHESGKLPWTISDDAYQAPVEVAVPHGDPRKWERQGKTLLEALEEKINDPNFVSYQEFLKAQCAPV